VIQRTSQIGSHGVSDDGLFGLKPADAAMIAMRLQAQKRPQSQADVMALSPSGAHLSSFDPTELLEASMVVFDRPGRHSAYRFTFSRIKCLIAFAEHGQDGTVVFIEVEDQFLGFDDQQMDTHKILKHPAGRGSLGEPAFLVREGL
jgi:hypothetical protein